MLAPAPKMIVVFSLNIATIVAAGGPGCSPTSGLQEASFCGTPACDLHMYKRSKAAAISARPLFHNLVALNSRPVTGHRLLVHWLLVLLTNSNNPNSPRAL